MLKEILNGLLEQRHRLAGMYVEEDEDNLYLMVSTPWRNTCLSVWSSKGMGQGLVEDAVREIHGEADKCLEDIFSLKGGVTHGRE